MNESLRSWDNVSGSISKFFSVGIMDGPVEAPRCERRPCRRYSEKRYLEITIYLCGSTPQWGLEVFCSNQSGRTTPFVSVHRVALPLRCAEALDQLIVFIGPRLRKGVP